MFLRISCEGLEWGFVSDVVPSVGDKIGLTVRVPPGRDNVVGDDRILVVRVKDRDFDFDNKTSLNDEVNLECVVVEYVDFDPPLKGCEAISRQWPGEKEATP